MSQASLKISNRKYWLLAGLILLVAGGLVFWQYQSYLTPNYDTSRVTRGELTTIVEASGVVRPVHSAVLTWGTSGQVENVNVKQGQKVSTDQLLANLKMSSVPQNIILAKTSLVTAQQNLDDALQSDNALAQALQNLANAKQSASDAQDAYNTLTRKRVTDQLISDTSDQIDKIKQQLKLTEYIFDRFFSHLAEGNAVRAGWVIQITNLKQNLADMTARYNWYTSTANPLDIEKAQAALDLAVARQEDAQRELDRVKSGKNIDDINAAKARVNAAQATLNQVKLLAPFAGTITQVFPKPADLVSVGQAAFQVDDLSNLLIDLQISEVDINSVSIGQLVTINLDAIPGVTYKGVVTSLDLAAQSDKGGANFAVIVTISNPDEKIRPGMTASVAITVKNIAEALLVPNQAIRMINGEHFVYVLKTGQPVPVSIRLGATANNNSQVVGGLLSEGDLIILNPPNPSALPEQPSPTP